MNDVISEARTLSEEAQRRFTLTLHDSVQRWDARKSRSRQPTVLMKRPQPKQPCQPRPRKRPAKKSKAGTQKASNTASVAREAAPVTALQHPPPDPPSSRSISSLPPQLPPPLPLSLLPPQPPTEHAALPPPAAADVLPVLKPNTPRRQAKRKRLAAPLSALTALRTVQTELRQSADACQELEDDPWRLVPNASGELVFKRTSSSVEVEWAEVADEPEADGEELIRTFFIHASNTTQRVFNRPNGTYIPFEQSLKSGLHLLHAQRASPE